MPLPVIADVWRVVLLWNQIEGIRPVNVLHVESATGTATEIVEGMFTHVQTDQFSPMPIGFVCDAMEITKLDGVSAAVVVPAPEGHTITGNQTANAVAGEAVIISFKTGLRGPAHRGRMFMGPVAENVVSGGTFDGDTNAIAGHWQDWSDALQTNSPEIHHCVASYVHATSSNVESYAVKAPLASARRRLLQVR